MAWLACKMIGYLENCYKVVSSYHLLLQYYISFCAETVQKYSCMCYLKKLWKKISLTMNNLTVDISK